MKTPLRKENETVEEWYPRFKEYQDNLQKEKDKRMEEHQARIQKINDEYKEVLERFYKEKEELSIIRTEIEQIVKEIKERRSENAPI